MQGDRRHGHRDADRAAGTGDRGGRRRRGRSRCAPTPAATRPTSSSSGLGMGPEAALAREAGLRLGETGAIEVDRTQRSRSHPEVFAAGDCSQTYSADHRRGPARRARHPRQQAGPGRGLGHRRPGGPLRRRPRDGADQGRRPGDRPHRAVHYRGRARPGYEYRCETIEGTTRAGYYPGAEQITVKLLQRPRLGPAPGGTDRRGAGQREADRRPGDRHLGRDDGRGVRRLGPVLRAAVLADLRPGDRRRPGGQPRRAGLSDRTRGRVGAGPRSGRPTGTARTSPARSTPRSCSAGWT